MVTFCRESIAVRNAVRACARKPRREFLGTAMSRTVGLPVEKSRQCNVVGVVVNGVSLYFKMLEKYKDDVKPTDDLKRLSAVHRNLRTAGGRLYEHGKTEPPYLDVPKFEGKD